MFSVFKSNVCVPCIHRLCWTESSSNGRAPLPLQAGGNAGSCSGSSAHAVVQRCFPGFLVAGVRGTTFLYWADEIQCGSALLEPFPIWNQGCKAVSAWGLLLPLLPSGSLSSSCGFRALETKMSWNVPPLRCSFFLCLPCTMWCFHLPGCACKAVCALAHLAYDA